MAADSDSILIDGEFAEDVAAALGEARVPYALTITRATGYSGPAYDPTPSCTTYGAQGWLDTFSAKEIGDSQGRILQTDVRTFVVAPTLAITPQTGDRITVRGRTLTVIHVATDAASALFDLQVRS